MLNDALIRALKPKEKMYRRSDGGGLFIQVETNGSKKWRIAYRFAGKQRLLGGGKYPVVGLADARRWRDEVKSQLADGRDPSSVRQQKKAEQRRASENSFETVARSWMASREHMLTPKYADQIKTRLEADVFPEIGRMPIDEVTGPILLTMLRKIERRGAVEMSHRVRAHCSQIFKFGIAEGRALRDPAHDVQPAQKRPAPVRHRTRVAPNDMGAFLVKLRGDEGAELTHLALKFTILTWVRTQETRFAQWKEFENLGGKEPLWRLPADRMKMRTEHVVPLSRQAVLLLERARVIGSKSKWVFPVPGTNTGVISENRMLDTLYRMGLRGKATVHGFRGTASTWANETLRYHPDVIELALAHVERNEVRSAYNAAQYLPARRGMLQDWADWLDDQEMIAEVLG